jgi:hypothetical protein
MIVLSIAVFLMCHSFSLFILDTVVLSKVLCLNYYLHKNYEICNCYIHALRCCCLLNLIIRHTIAIICTFFLTIYYISIQGPSRKSTYIDRVQSSVWRLPNY